MMRTSKCKLMMGFAFDHTHMIVFTTSTTESAALRLQRGGVAGSI